MCKYSGVLTSWWHVVCAATRSDKTKKNLVAAKPGQNQVKYCQLWRQHKTLLSSEQGTRTFMRWQGRWMIVIAMLFHCLQRAAEKVCKKFRQTVLTVLCCQTGFLSCRVLSLRLCKRDSCFVLLFWCPTFQVLSIKHRQGCSPFDNPNIPRDFFSLFGTNKSLIMHEKTNWKNSWLLIIFMPILEFRMGKAWQKCQIRGRKPPPPISFMFEVDFWLVW